MSDFTPPGFADRSDDGDSSDSSRPRHRRDDVPVDGVDELDLSDFGENPDTEVAG